MSDHPDVESLRDLDRGEFGMPGVGRWFTSWVTGEPIEGRHKRERGKVERVCNIMDEAQILYKRKAARYEHAGGDTADVLGAKGQFADINRKFWVLKGMLWDEAIEPYPDRGEGESVEEVLMDFIGHAALTIDFLRQQSRGAEEGRS